MGFVLSSKSLAVAPLSLTVGRGVAGRVGGCDMGCSRDVERAASSVALYHQVFLHSACSGAVSSNF